MLEMRVVGLGLDPASKAPLVHLQQVDGEAGLSILVGAMEALSISLVLNGERIPRPLSHDLMLAALKAFRANLSGVEICDLRDGVYYAALNIRMGDKVIRLDSRPSDAVALALRAGAPILVKASLLTEGAERRSPARTPEAPAQRPDAAADMAQQAGARREADILTGMLLRGRHLPTADPNLERRYRDLLRVLEPVTSRKM